jgi:hypothetical protein
MMSEPSAIAPDTKNWTWVLERSCPECGFDAATVPATRVAALLRDDAHVWARLLTGTNDVVRRRSNPNRWSALEYACHVRDVFVLFHTRLQLMLAEDDPLFDNWDQDATALAERYDRQDPALVSSELVAAAETLAAAFDAVEPEQWSRTGRRSDGSVFTVDSFSRYLIHDPIHHVWDVQTDLGRPLG